MTGGDPEVRTTCALVMGGYVNGLGIVRSLREQKDIQILVSSEASCLAQRSRWTDQFCKVEKSPDAYLRLFESLKSKFDFIVPFPTDDDYLEILNKLKTQISPFCYLPFNTNNLSRCLDKIHQYEVCKDLGIPCPKFFLIQSTDQLRSLSDLKWPLILKPRFRADLSGKSFRNLILKSQEELNENFDEISSVLEGSTDLIAMEFIPGMDSSIYAYTVFVDQNGMIRADWLGRKLSQYPSTRGVFSSASNEGPELLRGYGKKLIEHLQLRGICEPEFKFDSRDSQYKLTEINLRSMMWHRLGALSGVNLPLYQMADALHDEISSPSQKTIPKIHFIYMKHEILNLLFTKSYFKTFWNNISAGRTQKAFAVWDWVDPIPFVMDLFYTMKNLVMRILRPC